MGLSLDPSHQLCLPTSSLSIRRIKVQQCHKEPSSPSRRWAFYGTKVNLTPFSPLGIKLWTQKGNKQKRIILLLFTK